MPKFFSPNQKETGSKGFRILSSPPMRMCVYGLFASAVVSCSSSEEVLPVPITEPLPTGKFLSSTEAGEIAAAFMYSLGEDTRSEDRWDVDDVRLLQDMNVSRSAESDTTFYVVNFERGGYAVVAADRELDNKIYVYSDKGELTTADNPVLDIFLENAIASMDDAHRVNENNNTPILKKPMTQDKDLLAGGEVQIDGVWYKYYVKGGHSKKGPFLTTAWHQYSPYNILCPKINGTPTLVGCVAIAMGQICAYHQCPKRSSGHTYDWESMLSQSTHTTTYDSGIYDIAHLLREVGESVNMDYGTNKSGSNIDNALNGLKKMGFSSAKKKDYAINEVISSLNIYNPVYMRGKNSEGEGHAWVVDGYDVYSTWTEYYNKETGELHASYGGAGYTYLHFNVGWKDTENNAYYLCSGTDSNKTGKEFSTFGYTSGNKIITDIK